MQLLLFRFDKDIEINIPLSILSFYSILHRSIEYVCVEVYNDTVIHLLFLTMSWLEETGSEKEDGVRFRERGQVIDGWDAGTTVTNSLAGRS